MELTPQENDTLRKYFYVMHLDGMLDIVAGATDFSQRENTNPALTREILADIIIGDLAKKVASDISDKIYKNLLQKVANTPDEPEPA